MGRTRKSKYKPLSFECAGSSVVNASISLSMMQSDAWKQLSHSAMVLYLHMKTQLFAVPYADKPLNDDGEKDRTLFVFNRAMYTKVFPIFTNGEQFRRYSHELIKYGFIELVQSGKITRTKNIYRYSSNWKSWYDGKDFRPPDMQTHDEELEQKRKAKKQEQEQ